MTRRLPPVARLKFDPRSSGAADGFRIGRAIAGSAHVGQRPLQAWPFVTFEIRPATTELFFFRHRLKLTCGSTIIFPRTENPTCGPPRIHGELNVPKLLSLREIADTRAFRTCPARRPEARPKAAAPKQHPIVSWRISSQLNRARWAELVCLENAPRALRQFRVRPGYYRRTPSSVGRTKGLRGTNEKPLCLGYRFQG